MAADRVEDPHGLFLAADASDVARIYGSLDKRQCAGYEALLLPGKKVTSVFYVFQDKVWGFGLMNRRLPVPLRLPSASARSDERDDCQHRDRHDRPDDRVAVRRAEVAVEDVDRGPGRERADDEPDSLRRRREPVIVPRSVAGMTLKRSAQASVITTPPAMATGAMSA